jgi:filamentous hemagglutinin family protein
MRGCAAGQAGVDRAGHPAWRRLVLLATTVLSGLAFPALAQTLPTGGRYVAGAGSIGTQGAAMTITQSSSRGIISWQGFSIGATSKVQFDNGSGATLNRVTGANLSTIAGRLNATGSVYLVNPNGVVVGPGGRVLTGGSFVASTRDVPNSQFMSGGTLTFSGTSSGTVTNQGSIRSQDGDVVLIGAAASNAGAIAAPNGTAALAAGSRVLLRPENGPAGIYVVPDLAAKGDATNTGTIRAAAALLSSAGGNVYALAGNRAGLIQATGSKTIAGQVWLTAPNGTADVAGAVTAANADGSGGTILANGHSVAVGASALLSASGTRGGTVLVGAASGAESEAASTAIASGARILATGTGRAGGHIETSGQALSIGAGTVDAGLGGAWVIDPADLTIGPAAVSTIDASLDAGTSVTEETTATGASGAGNASSGLGDIDVDAPIIWNSAATLTLSAFHSINLDAAITATANGTLDVVADNDIGGASSGGALAIAMGKGEVQFTTPGEGALVVDGAPYTLIWTVPELEAINNNLAGNYALATNIDAAGYAGFIPIGLPNGSSGASGTFVGVFSGLGNAIRNLTINSNAAGAGLFWYIYASGPLVGTVKNIGLIDVTVTDTTPGAAVGALAGFDVGTIGASYATGAVSGGSGGHVGGLVGQNMYAGTITDSYAAGTVSGGSHSDVGGLAGYGTNITNSFATGTVRGGSYSDVGGLVGFGEGIANSFAIGAVTAGPDSDLGGLVGYGNGTITDSYAIGEVIGGENSDIGGLAGYATGVTGSYAIGAVTGGAESYVGGLAGLVGYGGGVANSFAISKVTGGAESDVGGLAGFIQFGYVTDSNFAGWVIGGTHSFVGGLAGSNAFTMTGDHATGLVIGGADSFVGGLVGINSSSYARITATTANEHVFAGPGSHVGPLAGVNYGVIKP